MNLFNLKIITPEKIYLDEDIKQLNIKTRDGNIGVLANHSPLFGIVEISILNFITKNNHKKPLAISGGIINVKNNQAVIITDGVSSKDDVNQLKAKTDKNKYEQLLKTAKSKGEIAQIEIALKKAINKLKL